MSSISAFPPKPLIVALLMTGLFASAASLPAAAQSPAAAAAAAAVYDYDLPAGPLATSLNHIARQAGLALTADAALIGKRRASPVRGRFEAAQALQKALAGSGLALLRTSAGGFTVREGGAEPAPADEASLPMVYITAQAERESPTGRVHGYAASRSQTGSKTDTPINEIPQSISVVTADQIGATAARTLQDALAYTAGVSAEQGSYGVLNSESFYIRGFEVQPYSGGILRDGMKYQANVYNGAQEVYGLERVEVLKGASSILYGSGAPGGLINTVSKRPSADPVREINLQYGSAQRKQVSGDWGGALDVDGQLTYRVTGLERRADSIVDFGRNDRDYLAAALAWKPSAATSLTLLGHYQRSRTTDNGNLPKQGTLFDNPNGRLPVSRYLGEPGFNLFDNTQKSVAYLFEHAFGDGWTFKQGVRHLESTLDYKYYQLQGLNADLRTVRRRGRAFLDDTSATTADTSVEYRFGAGAVTHTVLLGLDYMGQRHNSDRANTQFAPIDIYLPVYGQPVGATVETDKWRYKQNGRGLYLQDQMKIDKKWVLLLGGRQDRTRMEDRDLLSYPGGFVQKDKAFSGRAGLVYLADNGLSPFAGVSQSFAPEAGFDRLGNPFKPTRGEQYEAGLRYEPSGQALMLSAAVYQLTQTNVQTPDPLDPDNYAVQTGAVRSRGLELEAKGTLGKHLEVAAAYSHIDARTSKSSNRDEIGLKFTGVPRNTLSLWLDYRFGAFGLPGLHAGGGARHVGARPGNANGVPDQPAYTLGDLAFGYDSGHWRYALNVSNLADKRYTPSPCYGISCTYGQPRSVIATASYRF